MVHCRIPRRLGWLAACLVALSVTRAAAQPGVTPPLPQGEDSRPWARGVSEQEQALARKLYVAGNAEFTESRFAQALAKYREAARHWDHPAIRFNMVVCLINLDQPVEAKDELEKSLLYGAAPLGNEAYAQGLTYRKLLDAQLAHLEATCTEPGALVTLDGKYLFTGPGTAQQFVRPGEHQLAATKPGLRTAFTTFAGVAGKWVAYDLRPSPEMAQPHWRYWKHVLVGGAVLAGAGALPYLSARTDLRDYDKLVIKHCPHGCTSDELGMYSDVRAMQDRAAAKQGVAFSMFAAGGAAVLTGVLGLIIDQPRVGRDSTRAIPVVPIVAATPGGATVSLDWTY